MYSGALKISPEGNAEVSLIIAAALLILLIHLLKILAKEWNEFVQTL